MLRVMVMGYFVMGVGNLLMVVYIEADEEILYAPDLDYAWGFVRDRYNKGARIFFIDLTG